MQIQPKFDYKLIYEATDFTGEFPVNYLGKQIYSPSAKPISYMHYHNYVEIGYCYKGSGVFFVDGNVMPFSSGDCSIIFQNQIHIAQSKYDDPSEWRFVTLDMGKLFSSFNFNDFEFTMDIFKKISTCSNIYKKEHSSNISSLIYDIIMEMVNCKENYSKIVKLQIQQLILKLYRECTYNDSCSISNHLSHIKKISPSIKFITDNYANQINIKALANLCYMSETNFRRVFKNTIGKSPSEYIQIIRVKMAAVLLINSTNSILDISFQVGYPTVSSLNRHFHCIIGMTPRDWRKKMSLEKMQVINYK